MVTINEQFDHIAEGIINIRGRDKIKFVMGQDCNNAILKFTSWFDIGNTSCYIKNKLDLPNAMTIFRNKIKYHF